MLEKVNQLPRSPRSTNLQLRSPGQRIQDATERHPGSNHCNKKGLCLLELQREGWILAGWTDSEG